MAKRKVIFREDDALKYDTTYPGIRGWWKDRFPDRNFDKDWEAAEPTEVDGGDHFIRSMTIYGIEYEVCGSYDGYSVSIDYGRSDPLSCSSS